MGVVFAFLCVLALAGCVTFLVLWLTERSAAAKRIDEADRLREAAEARQGELEAAGRTLQAEVARLSKWTIVADADDKARELIAEAKAVVAQAESDARILISNAEQQYEQTLERAKSEAGATTYEARAKAREIADQASAALANANNRAAGVIAEANRKAEQIAGEAYEVVRNAEKYERTVRAMKNIIEGYGDEYLKPAESLLDDLAAEFEHKDAGQKLKVARQHARELIKDGRAAKCDYVEANRREGAERFVLDAFNGKVDSILSRVRHDNHGKLEQEIIDAFTIVNHGGKPFRDARITEEYLLARMEELKWGATAQELKRQEQEEQRRIREQIREEEKARREYERAIKEAAKEEDALRKAMARAEAQIAAATAEQRAMYEAQLAELNAKLIEAEERNQRAISMAQQTRKGHVYIISNVGSFGEDVYKIGVTRRLEPLERIKELGDASVPFDFDVHAIILSEDAPALETQLHKHFVMSQVNKVNHRKEFFRASIAEIRREIEELGIEAKWTMAAEAREWRETLAIERAMQADPGAREQWANRQLTLDPIDYGELVGAEE